MAPKGGASVIARRCHGLRLLQPHSLQKSLSQPGDGVCLGLDVIFSTHSALGGGWGKTRSGARKRGVGGSLGDSFRLNISSQIYSTVRQVALSGDEFTVPRSVQVITGQQREGRSGTQVIACANTQMPRFPFQL